MYRSRLSTRQVLSTLAIMGLLSFGSTFAVAASSQVAPTGELLAIQAVADPVQGSILVTGENFTPAGRVYIALYDVWGVRLLETRWVIASETSFGPNGSRDPAIGYVMGGAISEVFGASGEVFGPNGSRDPATGYVPGNSENSSSGEIFGPNGSRDPALGYEPGGAEVANAGSVCGPALMVRAFDEQAAVWGELLDVGSDAKC